MTPMRVMAGEGPLSVTSGGLIPVIAPHVTTPTVMATPAPTAFEGIATTWKIRRA